MTPVFVTRGGPALTVDGPGPYRGFFRMIGFRMTRRMILTFTSRITSLSGRKIETFGISCFPWLAGGGILAGFPIFGPRCEGTVDAGLYQPRNPASRSSGNTVSMKYGSSSL